MEMKGFLKVLILVLGVSFVNVNAKETTYYINKYDVEFTKTQYDYFSKMFYEGYQDLIDQETFKSYKNEEMNPNNVETKYLNEYMPLGSTVETTAKTLKISKAATTSVSTRLATVLTWKGSPSIRSYDVMGSYLNGSSLLSGVNTTVSYSGGSFNSNEIQSNSSGFGVSILLPSSGSSINISQTFTVNNGGHIYASYQHATRNVSLTNSKSYTIGYNGYGHVFNFTYGVNSYYDGMSGVDIEI